jgi:hypothetical protein
LIVTQAHKPRSTNKPSHSHVETQTSKLNDPSVANKSADLEQILYFLQPLKNILSERERERMRKRRKKKKFIVGTKMYRDSKLHIV